MPNLGSIETATGGTASWFENVSAASAHNYFAEDFSITGWFKLRDATSTACLLEYSSSSTVTAEADLMRLGLYRLGNGKLRVQWDRSTASLAYTADFNHPSLGSAPFFLGLVKGNSETANTAALRLTLNNTHVDTQYLRDMSVEQGNNGRWVLGASRRWGTAAGATPAFAAVGVRADDVAFFTEPLSQEKVTEIYRNGLRTWNEREAFESNSHQVRTRVRVEDGDGNLVDLSDLYGVNWIKSADYNTNVDNPTDTATVILQRMVGPSLNMSPLSTTSALNINASSEFEALLELRRRVLIEAAVVPNEWTIQGWEWEPVFDGYIDGLAWESETITITAADQMVILSDTFQLDPKPYDYYSGPVLSETHIQNVINDNVPMILTGTETIVFGYKGGTPTLYTPASTGWVLNYDDTPSGDVAGMLQSIADQLGWSLRYRWYDPLQSFRLTYFCPPREKRLDIESIAEDVNGYTTIVTRTPHGLTEDQTITISNTTNYNGTTTVAQVLAYNEFRTYQQPTGTPATETSGRIVYGAHVTLPDTAVRQYEALEKTAADIRNAVVVKFSRIPETATLPVTALGGGSGAPMTITVGGTPRTLAQLEPGQAIEVSGAVDADANVKATIGSISGNVITTAQNVTGAVSTGTAILKSEYIRYKTAFACNTTSINKYGLRQAAVYEASNGGINTATEAFSLAGAIVSDLAEPTADVAVKLSCAPWFELHDVLTLNPDKRQRWTTALSAAVTGVQHHFEGVNSFTRLALRSSTSATVSGVAPTNGVGWVTRIIVSPVRPGIADKLKQEVDLNILGPQLGGKLGRTLTMPTKPFFFQGSGGRRRMRVDMMEVHLGQSEDFIPDETTLVHVGRGT